MFGSGHPPPIDDHMISLYYQFNPDPPTKPQEAAAFLFPDLSAKLQLANQQQQAQKYAKIKKEHQSARQANIAFNNKNPSSQPPLISQPPVSQLPIPSIYHYNYNIPRYDDGNNDDSSTPSSPHFHHFPNQTKKLSNSHILLELAPKSSFLSYLFQTPVMTPKEYENFQKYHVNYVSDSNMTDSTRITPINEKTEQFLPQMTLIPPTSPSHTPNNQTPCSLIRRGGTFFGPNDVTPQTSQKTPPTKPSAKPSGSQTAVKRHKSTISSNIPQNNTTTPKQPLKLTSQVPIQNNNHITTRPNPQLANGDSNSILSDCDSDEESSDIGAFGLNMERLRLSTPKHMEKSHISSQSTPTKPPGKYPKVSQITSSPRGMDRKLRTASISSPSPAQTPQITSKPSRTKNLHYSPIPSRNDLTTPVVNVITSRTTTVTTLAAPAKRGRPNPAEKTSNLVPPITTPPRLPRGLNNVLPGRSGDASNIGQKLTKGDVKKDGKTGMINMLDSDEDISVLTTPHKPSYSSHPKLPPKSQIYSRSDQTKKNHPATPSTPPRTPSTPQRTQVPSQFVPPRITTATPRATSRLATTHLPPTTPPTTIGIERTCRTTLSSHTPAITPKPTNPSPTRRAARPNLPHLSLPPTTPRRCNTENIAFIDKTSNPLQIPPKNKKLKKIENQNGNSPNSSFHLSFNTTIETADNFRVSTPQPKKLEKNIHKVTRNKKVGSDFNMMNDGCDMINGDGQNTSEIDRSGQETDESISSDGDSHPGPRRERGKHLVKKQKRNDFMSSSSFHRFSIDFSEFTEGSDDLFDSTDDERNGKNIKNCKNKRKSSLQNTDKQIKSSSHKSQIPKRPQKTESSPYITPNTQQLLDLSDSDDFNMSMFGTTQSNQMIFRDNNKHNTSMCSVFDTKSVSQPKDFDHDNANLDLSTRQKISHHTKQLPNNSLLSPTSTHIYPNPVKKVQLLISDDEETLYSEQSPPPI